MTPDLIPLARESAVEVLRSLEWIWPTSVKTIKQCPCCYRWQSEGHAPDCRIAAALATPSGDDVADLRADRDVEADPDTSWQIVPVHPTAKMLAGARNGLRRLIESVSQDERLRRWGEPIPGRGYQVSADEKHTARWHGMLLNAPKPSTSTEDKLKYRENELTEVRALCDAHLENAVEIMQHKNAWEDRATTAEAQRDALQAEVERLQRELGHAADNLEDTAAAIARIQNGEAAALLRQWSSRARAALTPHQQGNGSP